MNKTHSETSMKHKSLEIKYSEYNSLDDLSELGQQLVIKARAAAKNAYAPYSNFHVGAALELQNGEIIIGNNQENAAYPSGLCAERVALFAANANYPDSAVKTIAISAYNAKGLIFDPVAPCGACRQAILESENRFEQPIRLILDGKDKIILVEGIHNLLPLSFDQNALNG